MTPFEFIPWILGQCKNVDEARALLDRISLYNENFSELLKLSPLHWHICDSTDLDGKTLTSYPPVTDWNVNKQN